MRRIALVLFVVAGAASVRAQDPPNAERKIAELTKENLALKRSVAALTERLNRLHAELAGVTHTMRITIPSDGERNPEHLKGIVLPPKPTKQDVRVYVARILRAAVRYRDGYGADDPEVDLLEKVGPANVDVLIEPLLYQESPNAGIYLLEAIKDLAGEEHKALILETLPLVHDLVVVVQARGWTEEAAPTLLKVLADQRGWTLPNPNLPTEWIDAVASLNRQETARDLTTYFHYALNRYATWKVIRNVPGVDLRAEVETLWPWAKGLSDTWIRHDMAAVAACHGHMDALEILFDDAASWPALEVIPSVTPYRSEWPDAEGAKKWFALHRDRLVFDAAQGKYVLRGK